MQIVAFALCLLALTATERSRNMRHQALAFLMASTCILVSVGNTGGLASPLLLSIVSFLVGSSMNPNLERRRYAVWRTSVRVRRGMAAFATSCHRRAVTPLAPSVTGRAGSTSRSRS